MNKNVETLLIISVLGLSIANVIVIYKLNNLQTLADKTVNKLQPLIDIVNKDATLIDNILKQL